MKRWSGIVSNKAQKSSIILIKTVEKLAYVRKKNIIITAFVSIAISSEVKSLSHYYVNAEGANIFRAVVYLWKMCKLSFSLLW